MTNNRRVVHLNTRASGGSIPSLIQSLNQGARDFGFSAEVFFGREEAPGALKHKRVGGLHSQAWDLLCSRLLDRAGRHSRAASNLALKWFYDDPPDLVHIHNLHGYWINHRQILVGLAQLNIPTVWTLHDYWPITGHCAYFENVGCKKWQVGCRDCPQIRHYPKSYMDGSARNFSEKKSVYDELSNLHIVAVSEHSRKIVGKSILASFPVTTIYNSIDTSIFQPGTAALQFPGKTVVGCVARKWDERKGLDDVIKLRKLLNESFIVLVVGLSGQQIRQLPPGIVGVPPTNSLEELRALYSSMDVFFNPSREETFGMATVEAMACGVPVVLYNVSANCEIQPGFMGIGIVENRNLGQAARAIMTIATDADRSLRESLVQYVAKTFSRDSYLKSYYGLYLDLLEQKI